MPRISFLLIEEEIVANNNTSECILIRNGMWQVIFISEFGDFLVLVSNIYVLPEYHVILKIFFFLSLEFLPKYLFTPVIKLTHFWSLVW